MYNNEIDHREYCYNLINRTYHSALEFRWACLMDESPIDKLPITKTTNKYKKPYLQRMIENDLKRSWWWDYNELTLVAIEELEWFTTIYLNIFNLAMEYKQE